MIYPVAVASFTEVRASASRLLLSTKTGSSAETLQGFSTRLGLLRCAQPCGLGNYRIVGLSRERQ